MPSQRLNQSSEYAQNVADIVATMSIEQAAQVYDFARFLLFQQEHRSSNEDNSWLYDSEAQMQAEDAKWDVAPATVSTQLDALKSAARKEIKSDATKPMFDDKNELLLDEFPHDS